MDCLLRHIDLMTRQRDRGNLEAALVKALHELATAEQVRLHKLYWSKGDAWAGLAVECGPEGLSQYDDGISGLDGAGFLDRDLQLSEYLRQGASSKSYAPGISAGCMPLSLDIARRRLSASFIFHAMNR